MKTNLTNIISGHQRKNKLVTSNNTFPYKTSKLHLQKWKVQNLWKLGFKKVCIDGMIWMMNQTKRRPNSNQKKTRSIRYFESIHCSLSILTNLLIFSSQSVQVNSILLAVSFRPCLSVVSFPAQMANQHEADVVCHLQQAGDVVASHPVRNTSLFTAWHDPPLWKPPEDSRSTPNVFKV